MAMGDLQRRRALIEGTNQPLPSEEELQQLALQAKMDAAAEKVPTDNGGVRADSGLGTLWGFGLKPSSAESDIPVEQMTPRQTEEAKKRAAYEETLRKFREEQANQY